MDHRAGVTDDAGVLSGDFTRMAIFDQFRSRSAEQASGFNHGNRRSVATHGNVLCLHHFSSCLASDHGSLARDATRLLPLGTRLFLCPILTNPDQSRSEQIFSVVITFLHDLYDVLVQIGVIDCYHPHRFGFVWVKGLMQ